MISTHILDTSLGNPAAEVLVHLEIAEGSTWKALAQAKTNTDGRISFEIAKQAGQYRLTFHIDEYFKRNKTESFFTVAPVMFQITDLNRKYHVPLLLNPFGYSTYRGS